MMSEPAACSRHREPGDVALFTEAVHATLLPPEVRYPRVLATGSEEGSAQVLSG